MKREIINATPYSYTLKTTFPDGTVTLSHHDGPAPGNR